MEELKNIIFENFKAFLVLVILIILAVFLFNNLDIGYRIKCSFGSKESCFIMGNYYSNCSDEYSKDGSTCPMNVKSERDKFDRHHRTYSLVTDYSGNDLVKSTEYYYKACEKKHSRACAFLARNLLNPNFEEKLSSLSFAEDKYTFKYRALDLFKAECSPRKSKNNLRQCLYLANFAEDELVIARAFRYAYEAKGCNEERAKNRTKCKILVNNACFFYPFVMEECKSVNPKDETPIDIGVFVNTNYVSLYKDPSKNVKKTTPILW